MAHEAARDVPSHAIMLRDHIHLAHKAKACLVLSVGVTGSHDLRLRKATKVWFRHRKRGRVCMRIATHAKRYIASVNRARNANIQRYTGRVSKIDRWSKGSASSFQRDPTQHVDCYELFCIYIVAYATHLTVLNDGKNQCDARRDPQCRSAQACSLFKPRPRRAL